jgi:hypothetical protein
MALRVQRGVATVGVVLVSGGDLTELDVRERLDGFLAEAELLELGVDVLLHGLSPVPFIKPL